MLRRHALRILIRSALSFITLLLLVSCSADEPAKGVAGASGGGREAAASAPAAAPKQRASAGAHSLAVSPSEATLSSVLQLSARGFALEEAEVVWLLNGSPVSTLGRYRFDIPKLDVRKGDTVQARATLGGEEIFSNAVEVENAPPELTGVRFVPETFGPGDKVGLEAEARDPDGDPVVIEYQWTLNGNPAGNGKYIGGELKRGDSFRVSATPFDGEARGKGLTLTQEMANLPPMFTQHNNYTFDGTRYTYAVKAADPDGDPLAYSLQNGPSGMSIDPSTGLVTWDVPADFLGTAAFVVIASDGQGGRAEMTLRFTLSEDKK